MPRQSRHRSIVPLLRRPSIRIATRLGSALLLSILASSVSLAAGGREWAGPAEDQDPTARPAELVGTPISLDEAIAMGLRNNLEVEVNRFEPHIAGLDADAAWGAFDPLLSSRVSYNDSKIPSSNIFNPTNPFDLQEGLGGNVGLSALVPYLGATVGVEFTGSKNEVNNQFPTFNPQLDSGLEFTADVPLMRGLLWNSAWTQVRSSKLGSFVANADFETSVMDTVETIINNYWNLVATKEQLRVEEKALETTNALLEQTQTQYDVGVVSRVEVVEAEAGVASAEFNRIVARNNYQNANDSLIATLLGRRLRASTSILFSPTDNPVFKAEEFVDVEGAVASAFAKRPEIRSSEQRIGQARVSEKFARNQRLPDVSFEFRHKTLGIDGDDAVAGTSADFGDSLGQFYSGTKDYTVGGRFSIPIPNTAARKNLSKAEFELRRAESLRTRTKQGIIVEIRAAARGLIASAEGVSAAERRRIAAAEQLRAERIRLEHGESTPFDVLQRQNDLVEAESQKVNALQAFRNSQTALARAKGTILEVHAVQIDQVRALD